MGDARTHVIPFAKRMHWSHRLSSWQESAVFALNISLSIAQHSVRVELNFGWASTPCLRGPN